MLSVWKSLKFVIWERVKGLQTPALSQDVNNFQPNVLIISFFVCTDTCAPITSIIFQFPPSLFFSVSSLKKKKVQLMSAINLYPSMPGFCNHHGKRLKTSNAGIHFSLLSIMFSVLYKTHSSI